jgi:hypothetical protein
VHCLRCLVLPSLANIRILGKIPSDLVEYSGPGTDTSRVGAEANSRFLTQKSIIST